MTESVSKKQSEYRKLPGRSRRRFSMDGENQRLWLGDHDILNIKTRYMIERYRRYPFADIQAIRIDRTNDWSVIAIIEALFLALFVTLAIYLLASQEGDEAAAFFGSVLIVLSTFTLVALIFHLLRGPTCRCYIFTPVTREELTSLRRLRAARNFVSIVTPLIESAQGHVAPEDLQTRPETVLNLQAAKHAELAQTGRKGDLPLRHTEGRLHMAFFWALVLFAVLFAVNIVYVDQLKAVVDSLMFATICTLNVVALVRQPGTDLVRDVRLITGIAMGFNATMAVVAMSVAQFYISAETQEIEVEELPNFADTTIFTALVAIVVVAHAILGVGGIWSLLQFRQRVRRAQQEQSLSGQAPHSTTGEP